MSDSDENTPNVKREVADEKYSDHLNLVVRDTVRAASMRVVVVVVETKTKTKMKMMMCLCLCVFECVDARLGDVRGFESARACA